MKTMIAICVFVVVGLGLEFVPEGIAEPVRNGNELALAWSTNNAAGKQVMRQQVTGIFHTFRYLRVTAIKKDQPVTGAVTVMTIEPSSDMKVALVITKQLSLDLANGLTTNDCVSAYGRIKTIGGGSGHGSEAPNLMVVDPALLKHKDINAPKLTKELLNEVDPTAH
ncbi:MAG: hypothetical protein KJ964_06580 [Verrucomicrobia bacterium]|nr:hypothetical protein [Verrucomicrobiota bacterium]